MDLLLKFPFCNLSCLYCLASSQVGIRNFKINLELIIKDIAKILEIMRKFDNTPRVILHGGEPLLIGKRNLEVLLRKLSEYGVEIGLQTNATLVDDKIVDMLYSYKVDVGVSLDGPRDIHDKLRVYPGGRCSFDDVIRGIKLLKKKYEDLTGIAVVTKYSLGREKDIYEVYESLGLNLQISFLMPIGRGKYLRDLILSQEEMLNFMKRLTKVWEEKGFSIKIYPHLAIVSKVLGGRTFCSYSPTGCFSILSYDILTRTLGPCPELWDLENVSLLSAESDRFTIEESIRKYFELKKDIITYKSSCNNCKFFKYCGKGCVREQIAYMGNNWKRSNYVHCWFRKNFIEYISRFFMEKIKEVMESGSSKNVKEV